MRFNAIKNIERTGFVLYEEGKGPGYSAGIEIRSDAGELLPLFPEYADEHFCVVAYEKQQPIRRDMDGSRYGFMPPPYLPDVWEKILWGRFSTGWETLPLVKSYVSLESGRGNVPKRRPTGDLLGILRQEFSQFFPNPLIVCLGDDTCFSFMKQSSSGGEPEIPGNVWADILFSFAEPPMDERIPNPILERLSLRKQRAVEQEEKLKRDLETLKGRQEALNDERDRILVELSEVSRILSRYGRLGIA